MKLDIFFNAVKNNNLPTVKEGIQSGISINSTNTLGQTALEVACELGHDDIADYLLTLEQAATKQDHDNPICIVGYSNTFPQSGTTPAEFWQVLNAGTNAITDIPAERWAVDEYFDADKKAPRKMYTKRGGFINPSPYDFDPGFFNIVPEEAKIMDPQQRVMLETVWYALEHAGINPQELKGRQVGVYCGLMTRDYTDMLIDSKIEHNNFIGTGNGASVLANRVSYFFDFKGPSISLDTACSSSLVTTHLACNSLRLGECEVAISAGINLMLAPDVTINCCKANMLSEDGSCKTFSATADGYGRGEGCGVVVLKRYNDAIRDNNQIFGIIRGTAVNQDGATSGLTYPNKNSQIAVIQQALKQGNLTADDIDFIEAHGTGTPLGDPIEISALKEVFATRNPSMDPVKVGSVKTNIGHLEAAAGVAGMIKVLLALEHQTLPALPLQGQLNPKINLQESNLAIAQAPTPWKINPDQPRRAGISSFGFSGTNAHCIIEESPVEPLRLEQRLELQWSAYPELPTPACSSDTMPLQLLTLSAKTPEALTQVIKQYSDWLQDSEIKWSDLVFSTNQCKQHFPLRLTIKADSVKSCLAQLQVLAKTKVSKANKLATTFNIELPRLVDIDLNSFKLRYQKDALYQSILLKNVNTIADEWKVKIQDIITNPASNSPVDIAATKLICLYSFYEYYKKLNLKISHIVSAADSHYAAAVMDGRITLADGLTLLLAHYQQNSQLFENSLKHIVIHPGEGLWKVDNNALWKKIYAGIDLTTEALSGFIINLASASQDILIKVINEAYLQGIHINWRTYWLGHFAKHLTLPQYPFQKKKLIFEVKKTLTQAPTLAPKIARTKTYQLNWQDVSLKNREGTTKTTVIKTTQHQALHDNWMALISQAAASANQPIIWLHHGIRKHQQNHFYLDYTNHEDWQSLFEQLKSITLEHVIDLSYLDVNYLNEEAKLRPLTDFLSKKIYVNHLFLQTLLEAKLNCSLTVALPAITDVANETLQIFLAGLQGQYRSISSQLPITTLQANNIDFAKLISSIFTKELTPNELIFTNNHWQQKSLQPVAMQADQQKPLTVDANEGAIITGGLGGIGMTLAKFLARKGVKHIALLARSKPNDQQQEQIRAITQDHQVNIITAFVDVTNQENVNTTVAALAKQFNIQLVFHLAGKPQISRFSKIQESDYREGLAAKVTGASYLKTALLNLPTWPRHVVYFSSSASLIPELGQTSYAVSNSALDSFALMSTNTSHPIKIINWGLWGATGAGADADFRKKLTAGSDVITEAECEEYLFAILNNNASQVAVLNNQWPVFVKHISSAAKVLIQTLLPARNHYELSSINLNRARLINASVIDKEPEIKNIIREIIHKVTGLKLVDLTDDVLFEEELSIDSNLLAEIREQIQEAMGDQDQPFTATLLFENNNINTLTKAILQNLQSQNQGVLPTDYIRQQVATIATTVKIKTLKTAVTEDEPPLILIHTIMGSVFFYRPLLDNLDYQGMIYGIDNPYFASLAKKHGSLEEMARDYATAIVTMFKGRPVRLAGLSFAGCVAYEIAQQLTAMGETVDNIIMFDSAMPGAGDLTLPLQNRQYVMGQIAQDINEYYQAEINNNQRILNAYRPIAPLQPFRVVLLKARSVDSVNTTLPSLNLVCNGWSAIFCPEVLSIPGSHFSLFDRGYINSTTQALRYVLALHTPFIDSDYQTDQVINQQKLLLQGAKNGDSYLVYRLLEQNVNPKATDSEGNTAAQYAAINDDLCSLSWLHFHLGMDFPQATLIEWAGKGNALKALSYLILIKCPTAIARPDVTLLMDTNKKQSLIFSSQQKPYYQREWMEILSDHNASSKQSAQAPSAMQILPASKAQPNQSSPKNISSSIATKIQCGKDFTHDVVTRYRRGDATKPNLFMIHAASGLALPYLSLGDLNYGDIYGISNPYFGKHPTEGFSSIEQMAENYLQRIRHIQPQGPYYLVGWSLGGIVAAAIASKLEQENIPVGWVVMIDSVNHINKPYIETAESTAIAEILKKNSAVERYEGLKDAIHGCYMNTSKLLHQYQAPTFSGKIYMFKAENHENKHPGDDETLNGWRAAILADPFSGWGDTFPQLEVLSIRGGHNDLFDKDNILAVEKLLSFVCHREPEHSLQIQIPNLWAMNFAQALRRKDGRIIDLLSNLPTTNYIYRDNHGTLLDAIRDNDDGDILLRLDIKLLAPLRTSTGMSSSDVALEFGLLHLFNQLSNMTAQTTVGGKDNFFQHGSGAGNQTVTPQFQPNRPAASFQ